MNRIDALGCLRPGWLRGLLAAGCACFAMLPALAGPVSAPPASAASTAVPEARPPRVRIESVRGVSWRGQRAAIDLVLRVHNPGGWSVSLDDIRLRCSFDGTPAATGRSSGVLDLPAHGDADVEMHLDVDGAALLGVLAALPPDGIVHYSLDGDAELSHTLLRLPFHEQGSVALNLR